MARLDLIRYDDGRYGLQEVDDAGELLTLYNDTADQIDFGKRSWTFVRTLAEGADYDETEPDDFWRAIEGVGEITPEDN
jgi:hypothetical protein